MLIEDIILDIKEQLKIYDTTRPLMDELKFVKDIAEKWHITEKEVLKIIRQIRKENKKNNKDKK